MRLRSSWAIGIACFVLLMAMLTVAADARARHGHHHVARIDLAHQAPALADGGMFYDNNGRIHGGGSLPEFSSLVPMPGRASIVDRGAIIAHPAGCPARAFCGCGAAVELFGRPVRDLWLAANWFRFPRAAPGPSMAAVRAHHVMVIRQYLGAGRALVYDANSGRGLTRVHVVSLHGYAIVNPKGR